MSPTEKNTLLKPSISVVATPIGNLQDITFRAVKVLEHADLIASEDTRVTLRLLSHLGIKNKKLISYHDKIEEKKASTLLDQVENESLALVLVSDAGTPLISDPGYHLIREAHKRKIPVTPVPGASAFTSLVCSSGLPNSKLFFTGFLPKKEILKKEEIYSWKNLGASIIFFETAPRLKETLELIDLTYKEAELCLGKELTKLYETIVTGSVCDILSKLGKEIPLKGEFVLMLSIPLQKKDLNETEKENLIKNLLEKNPTIPTKELSKLLKQDGVSSKEAYELILKLRGTI